MEWHKLALKQIHQEMFIRKGKSSIATMNLLAQIICSDLIIFFYICYHAGGSTKHFRWPKVKRRDEESSLSDALTPKIKETRLAGKMRTYLWVCLSTPYPHPLTSSSPCFCEKKSAWIQENGMNRCGTYYPLFSHLDASL